MTYMRRIANVAITLALTSNLAWRGQMRNTAKQTRTSSVIMSTMEIPSQRVNWLC